MSSNVRTLVKIAFLCATSMAFATTRLVTEGGTYTSVAAAVNDADAGDTILIDALPLDAYWPANLTITKGLHITRTNTLLHANIEGDLTINTTDTVVLQDLFIRGNISYQSNGASGLLLLSSDSIGGKIITQSVATSGSAVHLIGSDVADSVTIGSNYTAEILSSDLAKGTSIARGDVIGSKLLERLIITAGATVDDTIQIIGDSLRLGISWNSTTTSARISNNYFPKFPYSNNTSTNPKFTSWISLSSSGAGKKIWVSHNEIFCTYSYLGSVFGLTGVYISSASLATLSIDQNKFVGLPTSAYVPYAGRAWENNGTANFSEYYNLYYQCDPNAWYVGTASSQSVGNIRSNSNSQVSDLGSPSVLDQDVNGTRSDIGIEGGAYPYSQYYRTGWVEPNNRKPYVYEIQAPKQVISGQSFSIKAKAFAP